MRGDLKVIVVGPSGSGKTEIADVLSAASKGFQGTCKPTVALRVLEFSTTITTGGMHTTISVQLWDASGDPKYQMGWPAIAKNADGAIIVYNAFDKACSRTIETYAKAFTRDMDGPQVLIAANKIRTGDPSTEGKPSRPKLPRHLEESRLVMVNVKDGLGDFIDIFGIFLGNVYRMKLSRIEAGEQRMVGGPVEPEWRPPKSARNAKKQQQQGPDADDGALKQEAADAADAADADDLPE